MTEGAVCKRIKPHNQQVIMTCRVVSAFLRLMILGPPGSGKGTIGKRLADTFDLKHVSSGDALRDHIARSTAIGIQAKEFIEDGQ